MNPSYGYLGATWQAEANRRRAGAQQGASMWGQYAPQQNQYRVARQRFATQKDITRMGERDRFRNFGLTALTGLLR